MRRLAVTIVFAALSIAPPIAAQEAATEAPPPARTPKIAIVIVGDPDPATLAAVTALEAAVASDPRVTMPTDPAMRAALRGEGEGDGLDEVRAERRGLGLGEEHDATPLTVLGEVASADLVIVVHTAHGATHATAFDVLRRAFYDGELELVPLDEHAADFVARRARRAARPLADGETTHPPPAETAPSTTTPSVDPQLAVAAEAAAHTDPVLDFFSQNWPYFAAGALLIGGIVFVVLATTSSNSVPPPVLRFEAGGG
jgi:hypothetical protein